MSLFGTVRETSGCLSNAYAAHLYRMSLYLVLMWGLLSDDRVIDAATSLLPCVPSVMGITEEGKETCMKH